METNPASSPAHVHEKISGVDHLLIAKIAHEINNVAMSIASNLKSLKAFWPDIEKAVLSHPDGAANPQFPPELIREEVPFLITEMEESIQRLALIVKNMKDFPSFVSLNPRPVVVAKTVDSALHVVLHQLKDQVTVNTLLPQDLPCVAGDEQLLSQVFVNLLLNAAHAIRESRNSGQITIQGEVRDQRVTITVSDNGPGIPAEHLKELFRPFFTTRRQQGGTGLGLFISHEIIHLHHGQLTAESQVGQGATFTITLPPLVP